MDECTVIMFARIVKENTSSTTCYRITEHQNGGVLDATTQKEKNVNPTFNR